MHKKRQLLWKIVIIVALLGMVMFSVLPYVQAATYSYDLAVNSKGITFLPQSFFAGEKVRIYGTIENIGDNDMAGYVQFFQGLNAIADEMPFSSKAYGAPEEVWVDWVAQEGTYNIQFRILETTPNDQHLANNQTVSRTMTVAKRPAPTPPAPVPEPTPAPETTPSPTVSTSPPTPAPTTASTSSTPKVDPRVLGEEKERALAVIELQDDTVQPSYPNDTAAAVTAIVPETPYNTGQSDFDKATSSDYQDIFMLVLGGGAGLIVALLLLALLFWKKAKNHETTTKPEFKKQTAEQTLEDFLAPIKPKKK
ncbi:MAG: hypothetical protein Q8P11_01840 [bacterium]|nr:hypothetical protein [bacterium]